MDHEHEGDRGRLQLVGNTVSVVALTVLSIVFFGFIRRKASSAGCAHRLPPGPRGWPVVGSLLSLSKLPHRSFAKLSKEYGPLMFMRLGSIPTLVVSNPDMAKEIFRTHDEIMASRPDHAVPNLMTYNRKTIAFSHGAHWRRVRKICVQELLTSSRVNQFQGVRYGEVLVMLQSILEESAQGNALNMSHVLAGFTLNITTQMLWNKRHGAGKRSVVSAESIAFRAIIREVFNLHGEFNIGDFVPVLKSLDLQGLEQRAKNAHKKMDKFIENVIHEHRERGSSTATEGNTKEDFVDLLLQLSKQDESEPLSIDLDTVKAIAWDILIGSTEASATTVEWALAELVKNPSIMSRAQEELNLVVGTDRLVNEGDVPNLKYIHALVKETLRMHPPSPLGAPHKSMEDCEIAGYHVPAETLVFVNLWAIHRDAAVWERPLEFDPDRFLDSTVDVKGKDFELLPFGSGRRMCPGINMALTVVHLSIAQLLHAFTWTLPPDQKPMDMDMSEGFGQTSSKLIPLTVFAKSRLPAHVIDPTFA